MTCYLSGKSNNHLALISEISLFAISTLLPMSISKSRPLTQWNFSAISKKHTKSSGKKNEDTKLQSCKVKRTNNKPEIARN